MGGSGIERLLEVMARLRDPEGGCPWDVEQSFETLAPYTIEEAYEVDDAVRRRDFAGLRDELGDLLLQVVFHAQMAREQRRFDFADVVESICDKLERRHPQRRIENLLYLPKSGHLKEMSLGYETVFADILWMKAIGYFGGHTLTDKEYPWLFHILDQTTSLDPLFHHAYTFGGVVLAVEGDSGETLAQSIALLKKGMASWERPPRRPL